MSAATCFHAPRLRCNASRTSTSRGVLMAASIAKFCATSKQHFAPLTKDSQGMAGDSIVFVVARALEWHMREAKLTETALGKRAGVSPRTVANFLRPEKREISASGKVPSGKLTELEMIATALGVSFVDLVTDMTPEARERRRREHLALELLSGKAPLPAAGSELGGANTDPAPRNPLEKFAA